MNNKKTTERGKNIYLDHAGATPLDKKVFEKMIPWLEKSYANPSAVYGLARESRRAIDSAREIVAGALRCSIDEVFFTSGGTEANNWALFGTANATQKKHLITTTVEHHSVLHVAKELERRGYLVTFLPVDHEGFIEKGDFEKSMSPETFFMSVIYGHNEVGTIEDIPSLGEVVEHYKKSHQANYPLLHIDACQAGGALPLDVHNLKIELMTINGSKIYGPKGVGALYIKKGTPITPLHYGGGQEHRLRAGTENVAGIVGFAEALKIAEEMRESESRRLIKLRDYFIEKMLTNFQGTRLNGSKIKRLPNNIHVTFPGIDVESLLVQLDMERVCASSGSACTSGSFEASHVLLAMGLTPELAKNSVRFTLGRENAEGDIDRVIEILAQIIMRLKK